MPIPRPPCRRWKRGPAVDSGVCILDSGTGRVGGHRLDERFAMCSTFKLPLAALILREADQGRLQLGDVVRYTQKDMVPFAPVTSQHLRKAG